MSCLVLFGYFDESYFKKNFWYAAVLIQPAQLAHLNHSFSQILEPEGQGHKELHGSELFAGKGSWASYSIEHRKALYERCLVAICKAEPTIVARGVHMSNQNAREKVAFRYLVEEIDKMAEKAMREFCCSAMNRTNGCSVSFGKNSEIFRVGQLGDTNLDRSLVSLTHRSSAHPIRAPDSKQQTSSHS